MTAGPEPREHAPSAPDSDDAIREAAEQRLRALAGPHARLRPDQWTAIKALVVDRRRALVVQRTGWGKSAVYFVATALLRERGAGPTVIVSPLLALMRNQIAAAQASRHQRPDDQLGQHRGMGRGPRRDRGRHGRRAAGQPRAAEQPRLPRPHPAQARRDRPGCWSSTRRTASPTGGTTSGPTTAACARWSPGSRRTCRCSRPPRPPTPGSPATSRSNSAPAGAGPASHRLRWCCAARWTATACTWPWCGCPPRRSGWPGWRTSSANCPAPASSTP